MRQYIQKLGQVKVVILITLISIFLSVLLTFMFAFIFGSYAEFLKVLSLCIFVPVIIAPLASWNVVGLLVVIDNLEKEMRYLATFDSLTTLLNRRAFFHDSKEMINLAKRESTTLSIIAVDLDKFKTINDQYGHFAGDEVLKHFATTIKATLRQDDIIGRVGGEEFVVLLPNTTINEASKLSERLHLAIRDSIITYDTLSIKYTVSMGLISFLPHKAETLESVLKQADKFLYRAKESGRNCTVTF